MFHTAICDLLGLRVPILQGAMQGGGGVELVAAVAEAGGLGVLPTFGGTDQKLRSDIAAVRRLTARPFGVNIMPMGRGITERCVATCIELDVPVVTTGRADPGEHAVRQLKDAGIKVVSVIPTVEHARRMEAEGVDAVVASGTEAGGHVGTIATLPLVPMVVDAVQIPVVAAGGIADGRGFLAAVALGAVGIQMGTRGWHHISYSKMLTDTGGEIYETEKSMRSAEISAYGFGLRDQSMVDVWDDHGDGISMTIETIFPNFVLQQLRNCLAVRTIVPKGTHESELMWTAFGYQDDDERRLAGRLKQANMMGPAGLIAMEDGMIGGLVQKGIAGDLDKAAVLEMGGHGIEPIPGSRVSEGSVRGFWTGYRALMGL